jgi:hypothetical protein
MGQPPTFLSLAYSAENLKLVSQNQIKSVYVKVVFGVLVHLQCMFINSMGFVANRLLSNY